MSPDEISEYMVFRLSSSRSPKEVKLLHLEWAVVTQLDGEKSVGEIAGILSLSKSEAKEIFSNLTNEGLLDLVNLSRSEHYLPAEIFDNIEYELTLVMGPVASILLEDVLQEMGKTRDKFDRASLGIMIDFLTNHISNPDKQYQFQKNILSKIKDYILAR